MPWPVPHSTRMTPAARLGGGLHRPISGNPAAPLL